MIPPHLLPGHDLCYCKGMRWLVTGKLHTETYKGGLSMHALEEDIEKYGVPAHKDYYPGDIIEDYYFGPYCTWVMNGSIELYDGSYRARMGRYRSIDDPGEYGN